MKKTTLFLGLILFILVGCDKSANQADFTTGDKLTFNKDLLLTNFPYLKEESPETVPVVANCSIPDTREELENYQTVIKMYNGKDDAGISIPGFGNMKLGKEEISYSVYYIEPVVRDCNGVQKIYGIGYSYHLLIKKLKKGLSLDKLPYIAANVQLESGKTEVYYSFRTYGISGIPIVKFFKPVVNKPYDVEGFMIMQSSIDGIHGFLGDSELSSQLTFHPQEFTSITLADFNN